MVVLGALLAAALITGAVLAFSTREKAASVVDGVSEVYQAGDIVLTVDWVYADWNQILIGYSAEASGNHPDRVEAQLFSAALEDGMLLKGGSLAGAGQTGVESSVASFEMPETLRDQPELHIRLQLSAAHVQYPTEPATPPAEGAAVSPLQVGRTGGGEASFALTIPVTAGKVIAVDQAIEANGIQIRLKKVTLAPSLTTADLCFPVPDPRSYRDWFPLVTFEAGGRQFPGAGNGYQPGETESCQRVAVRGSVPLDQAEYKLRVDELVGFKFGPGDSPAPEDHPEEQLRVKGPWEFSLK